MIKSKDPSFLHIKMGGKDSFYCAEANVCTADHLNPFSACSVELSDAQISRCPSSEGPMSPMGNNHTFTASAGLSGVGLINKLRE